MTTITSLHRNPLLKERFHSALIDHQSGIMQLNLYLVSLQWRSCTTSGDSQRASVITKTNEDEMTRVQFNSVENVHATSRDFCRIFTEEIVSRASGVCGIVPGRRGGDRWHNGPGNLKIASRGRAIGISFHQLLGFSERCVMLPFRSAGGLYGQHEARSSS